MAERKKLVITAISGNEEKWCKQWCESIMKANPDLVVINLTQYGDNSEALFRAGIPEEKLILVKNKWEKDFSLARNQSLKHVPDWADYCFYIDLDEIITEKSYIELENFLHADYPPVQILCNIYNAVSSDSMVASLYYPRIWPHKDASGNLIEECFESTVHNQLTIDDKHGIYSLRSKISLYHYGYALSSEEMAVKHKRSEELIQAQIDKDEDNFFAHLNLAQLLRAKGSYIKALEHAERVLDIIKGKGEEFHKKHAYAYIMAKDQVATCYLGMGDFQKAIGPCNDALAEKPDHLDSIMNLSHAYVNIHDFERAEFWLKRYLFIRSRYDETMDNCNLILNHLNSSFIALYHLGLVNAMRGDTQKALEYYKKSFEADPKFKDTFIRYIQCLKELNRAKELNDEVNIYMRKYPDKAHTIYEYFGDVELENAHIENAKFNYYQALHINSAPGKEIEGRDRIKQKWESLSRLFGDVSHNYFDTSEKNEMLNARTS